MSKLIFIPLLLFCSCSTALFIDSSSEPARGPSSAPQSCITMANAIVSGDGQVGLSPYKNELAELNNAIAKNSYSELLKIENKLSSLLENLFPIKTEERINFVIKLFGTNSKFKNVFNYEDSYSSFIHELAFQTKWLTGNERTHFMTMLEKLLNKEITTELSEIEKRELKNNKLALLQKLPDLKKALDEDVKLEDINTSRRYIEHETMLKIKEILTAVIPNTSLGRIHFFIKFFGTNNPYQHELPYVGSAELFNFEFRQRILAFRLVQKDADRNHFLITLEKLLKEELSTDLSEIEMMDLKANRLALIEQLPDLAFSIKSDINSNNYIQVETRRKISKMLLNVTPQHTEERVNFLIKLFGDDDSLLNNIGYETEPIIFIFQVVDQFIMSKKALMNDSRTAHFLETLEKLLKDQTTIDLTPFEKSKINQLRLMRLNEISQQLPSSELTLNPLVKKEIQSVLAAEFRQSIDERLCIVRQFFGVDIANRLSDLPRPISPENFASALINELKGKDNWQKVNELFAYFIEKRSN